MREGKENLCEYNLMEYKVEFAQFTSNTINFNL